MATLKCSHQPPHQPAPSPQVTDPPPPNSGPRLTISEKALSHRMVALALLSWLPWTMTTRGRDRA